MGFGELLEVMGVFELQHGFSPGIKQPAEAGCEGVGGVYKESLEWIFRGYLKNGVA